MSNLYCSQGLAFTIEERQTLGIHGLLPARVKSQEEQVQLCKLSIERYEDPLNKYIYLMSLLVSSFLYEFILNWYRFETLRLMVLPDV